MTTRLTSIDPLSAGKVLALIYFGISLLFIPFILLAMLVGSHAPSQGNSPNPLAVMAGMGVFFVIVMPLLYAFFGFIGGLLLAVAYNLAAKFSGGFQLTFTEVAPVLPPGYTPPAHYPR